MLKNRIPFEFNSRFTFTSSSQYPHLKHHTNLHEGFRSHLSFAGTSEIRLQKFYFDWYGNIFKQPIELLYKTNVLPLSLLQQIITVH